MIQQNAFVVNPGIPRGVKTSEILKNVPLPADYAHLTDGLTGVPFTEVLQTITSLYVAGKSDDDIKRALSLLADHYKSETHRCAACLSWHKNAEPLAGLMVNGEMMIVTLCRRCERKLERGTQTPTMERNLQSYILGATR